MRDLDTTPAFNAIRDAAKTLHWQYGKGDIQSVRLFASGRLEVVYKCTSQPPKTAVGRILFKSKSITVYLHRHQRTVKKSTPHPEA